MNSNMTLSEKLQNIMDKCNEAEKCSNAERNQRFGKKLAVFKSTKEKTNNVSKIYEALKSLKRKKKTPKVANITCELRFYLLIHFQLLRGGPPRKSVNLRFSFFFGSICSSSIAE